MSQPIGHPVASLHRLLESSLKTALDQEDLTRRHWQSLNAIATGQDVHAALAPFDGTGEALRDLIDRGWVTTEPHTLTPSGTQAHARVRTIVGKFRARAAEGISEDEYRTAVTVLQRMVGNLERGV